MFTIPKKPNSPELRFGADGKYSLDGGVNLLRQETALPLNQASNILNLNADDRGTLSKRKGQSNLNHLYPSNTLILSNNLFPDFGLGLGGCVSIVYKNKLIVQWQTFLYSFNLDGSNPIQIYTGIAISKAFFIVFQGLLYMLNGVEPLQYDGTTVSTLISNAYGPVVSQGRKFDGTTSTLYEPLNLLTGKFTDMFSPLGTEKTFYFSFKGLDADTIISNNGTVEGTGFTVDRVNGSATFTVSPTAGTNTLKLTAYKVNATDALQIKNCTYAIEFSSRLFITGNPNYPNRLWKTGLTPNQASLQANYFPASGLSSFDAVTGIDKKVVSFIKKLDKLIYLKENSTHITYNQTQTDGQSGFPISNIDDTVGCDMPNSVQLVNSMPIFFNSLKGGYAVTSTTVLGENEAKDMSCNINGSPLRPGLLQESLVDLQNCSSFNDGSKYYLCIPNSGHVYVWDYSLGYNLSKPETLHWFIYDNIKANNFLMINNILCYSSSQNGSIVKFIDALNDFSAPIKGLWQSPLMDFGIAEYYKNVTDLWYTTRANANSMVTINYFDDNGKIVYTSIIPSGVSKSFKWSTWKWSEFTWETQKFPPTIHLRPGIKNVRFFQLQILNSNFNEDLSIIALIIKWISTRRIK